MKWAEARTSSLLAGPGNGQELNKAISRLEDAKPGDLSTFDVSTALANAMALIITGHDFEAGLLLHPIEAACDRVELDDGDEATQAVDRAAVSLLKYSSHWLVKGERTKENLQQALRGFNRAGEWQMAALLYLLLGQGEEALDVLSVDCEVDQEEELDTPEALLAMEPSPWRTLALAAHHLIEPSSVPLDELQQAVKETLTETISGYLSTKLVPAEAILPWLDLPNVLLKQDGDPWSMLRSVGDLIPDDSSLPPTTPDVDPKVLMVKLMYSLHGDLFESDRALSKAIKQVVAQNRTGAVHTLTALEIDLEKHLKKKAEAGDRLLLDHAYLTLIQFAVEWLLHGKRDGSLLERARNEMQQSIEIRSSQGEEPSESLSQEMALVHLLTGQGSEAAAALDSLQKGALDLGKALLGTPDKATTLALAAHCQAGTSGVDTAKAQQAIALGSRNVARDLYENDAIMCVYILLWLDLPNVLTGKTADPWAMLASLNNEKKPTLLLRVRNWLQSSRPK